MTYHNADKMMKFLTGKTIDSVDGDSCGWGMTLKFTDGSTFEISTDYSWNDPGMEYEMIDSKKRKSFAGLGH